jgi:hypothetical protein
MEQNNKSVRIFMFHKIKDEMNWSIYKNQYSVILAPI